MDNAVPVNAATGLKNDAQRAEVAINSCVQRSGIVAASRALDETLAQQYATKFRDAVTVIEMKQRDL